MLARLTDAGLDTFAQHFDEFRSSPESFARTLLQQEQFVEELPNDSELSNVELDFDRTFKDRKDFGEYLHKKLGARNVELGSDAGFWAWMALRFLPQILSDPAKSSTTKAVGHAERWLQTQNTLKRNRQLAYGPYNVCANYPGPENEPVRSLLLGEQGLATPGDVFENLYTGRPIFTENPHLLPAVAHLYMDESVRERGITTQGKAGGVRRLGVFLNQLSKTYYLPQLSTSTLIERLPEEYDRYLKKQKL